MKIAAVKLNDQTCIRGLKSQINMAAQQKFCPPHNPSSPGDNHAVLHPGEEQPGKPHFLGDQSRARARESVDMERGADEPTADLLSPSWRETSGCQLGLGSLAWRSLALSSCSAEWARHWNPREPGAGPKEAVCHSQSEQQEPPHLRSHPDWGFSSNLPPRLPIQHSSQRLKTAVSACFKANVKTGLKAPVSRPKSWQEHRGPGGRAGGASPETGQAASLLRSRRGGRAGGSREVSQCEFQRGAAIPDGARWL